MKSRNSKQTNKSTCRKKDSKRQEAELKNWLFAMKECKSRYKAQNRKIGEGKKDSNVCERKQARNK